MYDSTKLVTAILDYQGIAYKVVPDRVTGTEMVDCIKDNNLAIHCMENDYSLTIFSRPVAVIPPEKLDEALALLNRFNSKHLYMNARIYEDRYILLRLDIPNEVDGDCLEDVLVEYINQMNDNIWIIKPALDELIHK